MVTQPIENIQKLKINPIPSWNVFEIKYKYLEDLSDLKNYMRSALRGCRV